MAAALTLRSRVHRHIAAHPGATVAQIAEALDTSLPATANAVHSLAREGAIERTPEARNRRLGRYLAVPGANVSDRRPRPPKPAKTRRRKVYVPPPSACDGKIALEECWPEPRG